MRKLIVCNILSLDGYFAGPDDDVMVMPFDNGFSEYNAELMRGAGTLLLGGKTYRGFRSYWPSIVDDPNEMPVDHEISRLFPKIEKIVVSDSLTPDEAEGWGVTRVVRRSDIKAAVADLKAAQGRDIVVFGSHVLWNELAAAGVVDEFHFMIGAGVLAGGVRAFNEPIIGALRLLEARAFDASNLALLRYAVDI